MQITFPIYWLYNLVNLPEIFFSYRIVYNCDDISGFKQGHLNKIPSKAAIDLTNVTGVSGDDSGKTKWILTKVHGRCLYV